MVFLAGMSIVVGVSANSIADSQLQIEKLNHQPIFEFREYTDPTNSFMWLNVYNTGFPVENIEICKPIVLFQIDYTDKDNYWKTKSFILEGYYDVSHPMLPKEDELFRFGNIWIDNTHNSFNSTYEMEQGNLYNFYKLTSQFNQFAADHNSSTRSYHFPRYAHLKYTDIYGDKYERIYSVSDATHYKVHDDDFENQLKWFQQLEKEDYIIDLNNWSSEKIYEKLMED